MTSTIKEKDKENKQTKINKVQSPVLRRSQDLRHEGPKGTSQLLMNSECQVSGSDCWISGFGYRGSVEKTNNLRLGGITLHFFKGIPSPTSVKGP